MNKHLVKWSLQTQEGDGVIVGCANNHEWMLPWWWLNYKLHNNYPVTFFDFGDMSERAKEWCEKRGELKTLNLPDFVTEKEEIHKDLHVVWEPLVSQLDVWEARLQFFKKPFACLQSPYQRTAWIDLDAQVRQPIDMIFDFCENSYGMALVEEPLSVREEHEALHLLEKGEIEYNTGVVVFKRGAKVIEEWAEECLSNNKDVRGDQEALSRLFYKKKEKLPSLLPFFNWRGNMDLPKEQIQSLVIIHWLGACKIFIKKQMQVLSQCAIDLSL